MTASLHATCGLSGSAGPFASAAGPVPLAYAAMSTRSRLEAIWEALPEGLEPQAFALRRDFLLGQVAAGERVLDVGCGEGAFAAELQSAGADVLAVDVAEEPLARASRAHPGLPVQLIDADGPWDLEDSAYDAVWAGEVIEHVADTGAWLSQVRRVLSSGGRLILSTPDTGPLALVAMALSPRQFSERFDPLSDHLRFYNGRTLSRLLRDFGFGEVSVQRAGGLPGSREHLLAVASRSRW
jgi:2-polyprenyl-3-methyl-5-hydroxy-6-metoxy-1,4-benzoquinol methylase